MTQLATSKERPPQGVPDCLLLGKYNHHGSLLVLLWGTQVAFLMFLFLFSEKGIIYSPKDIHDKINGGLFLVLL